MGPPFTPEQFFDVFARYHHTVWPAPVMLLLLAVGAVVIGVRGRPGTGRAVNAILAALWLWMAIAYHLSFFATVTRAAVPFAMLFGAQAAVFAWFAMAPRTLDYHARANAAGIAGSVLIGYALLGYPLLGYLLGHRYPAAPTFGVPCPTTIFTLGLLLWTTDPVARRVTVIPVLWAIIATSAALNLGVTEDFGLTAAALIVVAFILGKRRRSHDAGLPRVATAGGR